MSGGGASRFEKGLLSVTVPKDAEFVRIHWQTNGPVFFSPKPGSPPSGRFDAPAGQFRTLYAAEGLPGAYVETVLRHPYRVMRRAEADERAVTRLQVQRSLQLAKIMDEGLQWHGVHAGDISIDDYSFTRQLALDLHTAFPAIDGLAYRSRYNNGQVCFAIFDRVDAADFVPAGRLDLNTVPGIVDDLMRLYGAVFDTSLPP